MFGERSIFHIHIPKTAGLTLRMIFAEILGMQNVFKLGVVGLGRENTFEDFMGTRWPTSDGPAYKVYLGHFPFGAQYRVTPAPFMMTCIRRPIERVISRYEYVRRGDPSIPDIADYVAADPESNNGMVRRLCGLQDLDGVYWDCIANKASDRDRFVITDEDLALAIKNLTTAIDFVMIQERMTESLVALRHILGSPPLVSLHNQSRNSNSRKSLASNYSEEVIDDLKRRNGHDLSLYETAVDLFEKKLDSLAIGEAELRATDDICSALMGGQDLTGEVVNQRLSGALNNIISGGDTPRAEMMLRLLVERIPNSPQLAQLHAAIKQECEKQGKELLNA